MKLLALSLVLAVVAAAAAVSTTAATASSADFCGVARGVASDIVRSTSFASSAAAQASIRTTYEKIAAAEPSLLSAAPGPVGANLRPVFAFVNLVIADFRKVNWNLASVAQFAPSLVPRAKAIAKPLHALRLYFRTTCRIGA